MHFSNITKTNVHSPPEEKDLGLKESFYQDIPNKKNDQNLFISRIIGKGVY